MCGIAGFIGPRGRNPGQDLVRSILKAQHSRGPDFTAQESFVIGGQDVILGHNRLSIIDLDPRSHQPLFDRQGEIGIIYNGEIYNYLELRKELANHGHTFSTESDTEVIITAYREWGQEFAPRLNGMFAFAILDRRSSEVLLVRDRFGVKPLMYFAKGGEVAFASTGRDIAKHYGLSPSLDYIRKGITSWNFDDSSSVTQYDGLHQVEPGCMIQISCAGAVAEVQSKRWYELEREVLARQDALSVCTERELIDLVYDTLESAIQIRLRADVPVAIALSGGLDSGSVACMVGRDHPEVRAFSFGDPEDLQSEGPLAKELADSAGIGISFIKPTINEMVFGFDLTLEAQDAPFVGPSQVAQYLVAQQVKQEGYTVLLGGQGGDEGYMGYRKYFLFALKSAIAKKDFVQTASLAMQATRMAMSEGKGLTNYWRHRGRFTGKDTYPGTIVITPCWRAPQLGLKEGDETWKRQALDVTDFSLPTLLRYEDRNGMAHSIESRLPFMDFRMIELGLALPQALKVRKGYGKWAIRKAMEGVVPNSVRLARYKKGFPINTQSCLAAGLGERLRENLRAVQDKVSPYVTDGFSIDVNFSDENLLGNIRAMPELISLIWMGRRL